MAITRTYAVGSFNRVVRQDDHNGTWIDISPNADPNTVWRDVMTSPVNPAHVVIVGDEIKGGGGFLDSGILVSTDAGATWTVPYGNWDTYPALTSFYEVWCVDSQNIWIVGNNGWVVKSQNGGLSFGQPDPGNPATFPGGEAWAGTQCIHAIDSMTAVVGGSLVAVTGDQDARVWKTINGGNTWTELNPSPNYYIDPPAPNLRNAWGFPVSKPPLVVGLTLISGGTGYFASTGVPAISNGTGEDLTLNITTSLGAITGFVIANPGRDYNVGEVVTVATGANDATLQVTAIEPSYPIGIPRGIWMSEDEQIIVVTTNYTQQISTDGGQNFTTTGSEQMLRAGVHLTWYPSHEWQSGLPTRMRHVGGIGIGPEVIETLDLGATWSTTRQDTGVHMVGAHFYSPQNGYYTHTNKLYRTLNGGVTGIEVHEDLGFPTWQAIWTEEPTIIYRLIDCAGVGNDQFVSDPNMANYVGQVIHIVAPDADLPADLCWIVEEYDQFHLTYDDPVPVLDSFETCLDCNPNYYELVDCEGNEASIYTTTDLSPYMPAPILPTPGPKISAVGLVLTPCCGGTVYTTQLVPVTSPQCTAYQITVPTDSLANTITYTDCNGIVQTITYPFNGGAGSQTLYFDICVLDGSITDLGVLNPVYYVNQGDCSPPPSSPVITWPTLGPGDQVIIWDDGTGEACYTVTNISVVFSPTQPPGNIDTPLDSEVTVLAATDCTGAASENPICICDTPEPPMVGGNVIQIEACPGVCWTVNQIPPDPTLELTDVVVTDDFVDCEECLPKDPPPPPIIIRNRKVKPGYDTPGCPPAYVEKVNCSFAEALYKEVVAKRYGITVCCEEEENKYLIRKYLMDLKAIFDPEACTTIEADACCPPCNVSSILNIHEILECLPPLNVSSVLLWPADCLPPINVSSELIQEPKCTTYRVTVPAVTVGASVQYRDCFGQPRLAAYGATKLETIYFLCALDSPAPIPINCTIDNVGSCTP